MRLCLSRGQHNWCVGACVCVMSNWHCDFKDFSRAPRKSSRRHPCVKLYRCEKPDLPCGASWDEAQTCVCVRRWLSCTTGANRFMAFVCQGLLKGVFGYLLIHLSFCFCVTLQVLQKYHFFLFCSHFLLAMNPPWLRLLPPQPRPHYPPHLHECL